jgi:hypothetical protein
VGAELLPWFKKHPGHRLERAIGAQDESVWLFRYDEVPVEHKVAHDYYVTLLLCRKDLLGAKVREAEHKLGRQLTSLELEELAVDVHRHAGPRGYILAKKGFESASSPNFSTDERLVVTAVFTAIELGREIFILTKDEDLQEQLFKLQWLLNTHYRSMLFAARYATDPLLFRTADMPSTSEALDVFQQGGRLIHRSPRSFEDVLPPRPKTVMVNCLTLGHYVSQFSFCAEQGMAELLRVKSETAGMNTNRFGDQNSHIWLAPLPLPDSLRETAGLVNDRKVSFLGDQVRIPRFDMLQAAMPLEQSKAVVESSLALPR